MDNTRAESSASITPGKKADTLKPAAAQPPAEPTEIGGPQGPEPTRFGDWERGGRCTDF
jgi:hypothetical protein